MVAFFFSTPLHSAQSVWTSLPAWHGDIEAPADRSARLQRIDLAVTRAVKVATCDGGRIEGCKKEWRYAAADLQWLLIAQAFFETRLAVHVHEDRCRVKIGECDSGRAKSLWQIQATPLVPVQEWKTLGGADQASTDAAAIAAMRVLSRNYNRCRSIAGAISGYATGHTCNWKPAQVRARWIRRKRKLYSPRL